MLSKTIFRCSILFILGLACIFGFTSCTNSVTTGDDTTLNKGVFLEDTGNGLCRQLQSGLMWQINESETFFTWEEANAYVNMLHLGGFTDWRLPTRDECATFAELLQIEKGTCPIKFKRAHWISNGKKNKAGYWDEYPLCGGSELRWMKGEKGSVRAVRP